eukprot:tig00000704_g3359.t1
MASAFALSALSGIRHTSPLSSALYAPAHSSRLAPPAPRAQRQLGFSASPALGRRFRVASEPSCTGCGQQARRAFEHARRALRIVAEDEETSKNMPSDIARLMHAQLLQEMEKLLQAKDKLLKFQA